MRFATQRLQAAYHLHMARRFLVGRLDHEITAAEWARAETAREHVDQALRALGSTPDQHEPSGGPL